MEYKLEEYKPTHKYVLDIEEMHCPKCRSIIAHVLAGEYYTCLNCGNQLGKLYWYNWYAKLIKKLFI